MQNELDAFWKVIVDHIHAKQVVLICGIIIFTMWACVVTYVNLYRTKDNG